jgi:2'-5' RNA ligase
MSGHAGAAQCSEPMNAHPFYTVAYLDIPPAQRQWIQAFRQRHDPHFHAVEPHFTLVFGIRDVEPQCYLDHIASVAKATQPIRFRCLYAMLGADDVDDMAYVFLVPNEGNAEVSLLHDRLYSGLLQPFHRLAFPYIPHITIASMKSFEVAKQLCDELNLEGVCVEGALTALSASVLKDGKLQTLRSFALGG